MKIFSVCSTLLCWSFKYQRRRSYCHINRFFRFC